MCDSLVKCLYTMHKISVIEINHDVNTTVCIRIRSYATACSMPQFLDNFTSFKMIRNKVYFY